MRSQLRPALLSLVLLTLLTGMAYPAVVTGLARLFFRRQSTGSLVLRDGKAIGSDLIGQEFEEPRYFWGRLSATSPAYNAASSSGSNYGPLNPALRDAVEARVAALRAADSGQGSPIPVDLVTASGSGLDPHISPAAAAFQVARVARARGLDAATVQHLVDSSTEGRQLGVLGEPRVNVLRLNLALDSLAAAK